MHLYAIQTTGEMYYAWANSVEEAVATVYPTWIAIEKSGRITGCYEVNSTTPFTLQTIQKV